MPLVENLPSQQTLQSLRKVSGPGSVAAPQGSAQEGGVSAAAGFEGSGVNETCRGLMSGSWLWARQLLIHDLGTFK
jgi:hypothetical protein